jgi:membrane protease YdiL (CAAX protease family)
VLPLLPVIIVLAGMNAFSETMSFRAPMLATLHEVVGKQHTLILTAAYFGIAHFYGVPYGLVGVVMAGFLGWFLGKAMLETRGLVWPWFIHFCQDALIFTFLAIGSVVPGG